MSTQQPLSKLTSALIFISGAYLFFITLVLAPYINFTVFSSFHAATKLVFVTLAGIVSAIQLFVVLPYVKRGFMRTLGSITEYGIYVSLIGLFFSVVLSASVKTSLFGMYTGWESNVLVFLSYGLLLLAWYTYFLVLKQYGLEKIVFHTLLQLGLVVAIVYSIGEYYLWKPTTGYVSQTVSRISLGFRNPLFAAYFLGMLWSYSFAQLFEVLLHTQKKAAGIAKLIFGVILYIGITFSLILTFTRSALLSAGITAVVYVILRLLQSKQEKIGRAQILVAAALIALIAFTVGYSYRKEFSLRNTDLVTESQNTLSTISTSIGNNSTDAAMEFYQKAKQYSSSQIRLLEWKWGFSTWTGSLKNFLVGVGPDAGFFEMPKYRDAIFNNFPTDSSTKPFYVRSLYINTLMQIGIVSSLGIILVIFGLLQQFSKIGNKDWAVFALILAFFAQGIFYYPTHITIVLLIFALGYLFTLPRSEEEILYRKTNASKKYYLFSLPAGYFSGFSP